MNFSEPSESGLKTCKVAVSGDGAGEGGGATVEIASDIVQRGDVQFNRLRGDHAPDAGEADGLGASAHVV